MLEDDLPLYDLFTRLRAAEFPLGVSDYNLLLQMLLAGYFTPHGAADESRHVEKPTPNLTPQPPSLKGSGENSKPLSLQERGLERGFPDPVKSKNGAALKQLCQTLWVKSVSQLRQFEAIFDEMVVQPQSLKSLPQKEDQTSTATLNQDTEQNDQGSHHTQVDEFTDKYFFFAPTPDPEFSESAEEVEVARAVRTGKQREWVSFKPSGLPDEYFPVTARQMEQG